MTEPSLPRLSTSWARPRPSSQPGATGVAVACRLPVLAAVAATRIYFRLGGKPEGWPSVKPVLGLRPVALHVVEKYLEVVTSFAMRAAISLE